MYNLTPTYLRRPKEMVEKKRLKKSYIYINTNSQKVVKTVVKNVLLNKPNLCIHVFFIRNHVLVFPLSFYRLTLKHYLFKNKQSFVNINRENIRNTKIKRS